jgi:hypothetical protein
MTVQWWQTALMLVGAVTIILVVLLRAINRNKGQTPL